MAVSQKKKPSAPDISENLRYLDGTSENLHQDNNQIQTGAPFQNSQNSLQTPIIQKKTAIKDTQIIFRTTEENKNQLKGFCYLRNHTFKRNSTCMFLSGTTNQKWQCRN